jgi:hypothetical protein
VHTYWYSIFAFAGIGAAVTLALVIAAAITFGSFCGIRGLIRSQAAASRSSAESATAAPAASASTAVSPSSSASTGQTRSPARPSVGPRTSPA